MTIERQSRAASAPTTKRRGDHQTVPALVARPGGAAERFADALGDRHPALVFALALLGGFLVLAAASILLALLVVHVLVSGSGLGWPARRRASTRRSPTTATARSPRSPKSARRSAAPRSCRSSSASSPSRVPSSAAGSSRRSRSSCCSPSRPPTASRRSWFPETDRQSTGWKIYRSTPAIPRGTPPPPSRSTPASYSCSPPVSPAACRRRWPGPARSC